MTTICKKREERKEHKHRETSAQPLMLTVRGVATLLVCSPRTVYRLVDSGRIPRPIRLGSMVRWQREPFQRWIDNGCLPPMEDSAFRQYAGNN